MIDADTQITIPKLRPPIDVVRKALEGGARRVARLVSRRTKLLKRVAETDDELSAARKLLRDLIRDLATPVVPGVQLTHDDVPDEEV